MSVSRRLFAVPAVIFFAAACSGTDALKPASPTEAIALVGQNGRVELPEGIDPLNADAMISGSAIRMAASSEGFEVVSRTASAVSGPQVITNGVVTLGVRPEGDLNTSVGGYSSARGTFVVGLRYNPTNMEATAAGCTCEGWGVGDKTTGFQGSANSAVGGIQNLTIENFSSNGIIATSVTNAGGVFRVTHRYAPSVETPNLYEVEVTIENISATNRDVVYRRVMDWDIEPTPFAEMVTIQRGTSTELIRSDNNGFNPGNPFQFSSYGHLNQNIVDNGPADHGAVFDFGFGILAPGAKKTFKTFYGAAGNEVDAKKALGAVGAEVYSLGQPSSANGASLGVPNTFMFAFGGVGGTTIEPPPVDNSPPTVVPVVTGTLGANGWYTSDINVSWQVADAQSPITSPACTASTVTADTDGVTFTCTATSQGGTTTKSVTVKRDASTATVTPNLSGTLGLAGWYTSDVGISWSVTPNGPSSATSSCVASTLSSNTTGQSYDCTATTGAGLTSSGSVTVKRDASAPTVTPVVTGTVVNGWYTSNATISWNVSSNGPSLATSACVVSTQATDTNGATFSCTATSGAGITTSASTTVKRDATNPTVGYTGNAGVYTIDQTVAITCSYGDAMSGVASQTCANINGAAASFSLGAHTYSATVTDKAGNSSTASTTFTVKATAASLCEMTRLFVTGPGEQGVENSLCGKLEKGNYGPYINEVQAQSGKKITAANAALLILWAQSL